MIADIRLDLCQLKGVKRVGLHNIIFSCLISPCFRAVTLYRIGHFLYIHNQRYLMVVIRFFMFHTCHCEIGFAAEIGPGFCIRHTGSIVIGGKTTIGKNCEIRQSVTIGGNVGRQNNGRTQPVLGDNVRIGAGAIILGPVKIGDNSIIGANSVVIDDVSENSRVAGVPAKEIHQLSNKRHELDLLHERILKIEKMLKIDTCNEN